MSALRLAAFKSHSWISTASEEIASAEQHLRHRYLTIELVREIPEAMKPRRIAINGTAPSNVTQIKAKAA
jgi:molecular chaperone IbpA